MWALTALLSLAAAEGPFIDVATARTLTASAAVVLDARGRDAKAPYIEGARVVDWLRLRDGWLRTGRLDDDPQRLRAYFERRGVSDGRPVIVYGAMADGWGEEGRIWWTLRYLGHRQTYILDGGLRAWVENRGPVAPHPARHAVAGRLRSPPQPRIRVDWQQVDRRRRQTSTMILDVRTRAEYDGATPYWSTRGGHIPGARWLHWKTLVGTDGRLLPPPALRTALAKAGLKPNQKVVTYCTGGVRSAFVLAALLQAGFHSVANYDGSWWDWSRRDAAIE